MDSAILCRRTNPDHETRQRCLQICDARKKMDLGPSGEEGDEAKRAHMLLKAARKRKIHKPLKAMSSMDNLETVPMHLDDYGEEDWATLGFFVSDFQKNDSPIVQIAVGPQCVPYSSLVSLTS